MTNFNRFSLAQNTVNLACVSKDKFGAEYLHDMFTGKDLSDLMLKVYTASIMSEFEMERLVKYQNEGVLRIVEEKGTLRTTVDYTPVIIQ